MSPAHLQKLAAHLAFARRNAWRQGEVPAVICVQASVILDALGRADGICGNCPALVLYDVHPEVLRRVPATVRGMSLHRDLSSEPGASLPNLGASLQAVDLSPELFHSARLTVQARNSAQHTKYPPGTWRRTGPPKEGTTVHWNANSPDFVWNADAPEFVPFSGCPHSMAGPALPTEIHSLVPPGEASGGYTGSSSFARGGFRGGRGHGVPSDGPPAVSFDESTCFQLVPEDIHEGASATRGSDSAVESLERVTRLEHFCFKMRHASNEEKPSTENVAVHDQYVQQVYAHRPLHDQDVQQDYVPRPSHDQDVQQGYVPRPLHDQDVQQDYVPKPLHDQDVQQDRALKPWFGKGKSGKSKNKGKLGKGKHPAQMSTSPRT